VAVRSASTPARAVAASAVDLDRVRVVAGRVKDPEVRTPIVDLGLLDEVDADGGHVVVRFHLTSPLCPHVFASRIGREIRQKVSKVPGVESVEVILQDHWAVDELYELINGSEPRP
jgi:metal-sulfur cluster biosynthetic enzyme